MNCFSSKFSYHPPELLLKSGKKLFKQCTIASCTQIKFYLSLQINNDEDVINAALKQVARLEQLINYQPADRSLTSVVSPDSSGTF